MGQVVAGRYTAQVDEPFVVFLIGVRINKVLAVRKWVPTFMAMGPMLRTLYQHPEKGFLGGHAFMGWRNVMLVQYWRSFDDLEHFAKNPSDPHLNAWRRFNRAIGSDGSVGIWHETYAVNPGQHEAVYGNMPVWGLAAATSHVPAVGRRAAARDRLAGEAEPQPSAQESTAAEI